jgi:hypothetical protein
MGWICSDNSDYFYCSLFTLPHHLSFFCIKSSRYRGCPQTPECSSMTVMHLWIPNRPLRLTGFQWMVPGGNLGKTLHTTRGHIITWRLWTQTCVWTSVLLLTNLVFLKVFFSFVVWVFELRPTPCTTPPPALFFFFFFFLVFYIYGVKS